MKIAIKAAALAVALFGLFGPTSVRATDMDDYRWNPDGSNCRIVEFRTTNRWGDDVTIRRRVCD